VSEEEALKVIQEDLLRIREQMHKSDRHRSVQPTDEAQARALLSRLDLLAAYVTPDAAPGPGADSAQNPESR
jgi:hypothetical protein